MSGDADAHTLRQRLAKAEDALARYRSIVDNAVIGITQSTPEGRFLMVNPAMARMLGYGSPGEMLAAVTDIQHQLYVDPDRRTAFRSLLEKQDVVHNFETEMYRKDGSTVWLSLSTRAVRDPQGALLYYEGMAEDVTDRRAAEARFKEMVENSIEGFYQATPDGRYLYVNKALARLYGYDSPEELMRVPAAQIYVDPGKLQELRHLLDTQGEARNFEAQRFRKDGSVIWASANVRAVFDRHGNRLYTEGTVEDITEKKLAALSLQAEAKGLQTLIEDAGVGVMVVDAASRRILLTNGRLGKLLGLSLQPGDPLERYLAAYTRRRPDGRTYREEEVPVRRALDLGEIVRDEEMHLELSDARMVTVISSATPILDEDGGIAAAIAVLQEKSPAARERAGAAVLTPPGASPTATTVDVGSATDPGPRSNNEDAVYVGPSPQEARAGRGWVCAIADGMGGAGSGEVASALAVQTLAQAFARSPGGPEGFLAAVREANAAVIAQGRRPENQGMGTTLTAALIQGWRLTIAHAGDSRAYLLRDGQLRVLTTDHSWVAELIRAGAITQEQAKGFVYRNVVTRVLGRDPALQIDRVDMELRPGDRLLLCCDGLYKALREQAILEVLLYADPQAVPSQLVREALRMGTDDNTSAIVIALT